MTTVPVTCIATDQKGNAVSRAIFTAVLNKTEIYNGFVVPEKVTATADTNGIAILALWPNELGVKGSMYQITAVNPDTMRVFLDTKVTVPNTPCNLHQIITAEPYPATDASAQALAAAQGALALATAQAGIATVKAGEADASADAAAGSASAAATSALAASISEGNADASEAAAAASALDIHANWQDKLDAADAQATVATDQAVIATAQAVIATAQAVISTTQASTSTTARIAAEAARDAAVIGSGVYATEALGRAAVADGVAFKVQGSGNVAAYEYRRTNSTTSSLIATYPAASLVSAINGAATFQIEQSKIDRSIMFKHPVNAFVASTVNVDYAPLTSNGDLTALSGYFTTDYISVLPGGFIFSSISQNLSDQRYQGAFYDSNRIFLSNAPYFVVGVGISVPVGAMYFRCGFSSQVKADSVYMVCQKSAVAPSFDSSWFKPKLIDSIVSPVSLKNIADMQSMTHRSLYGRELNIYDAKSVVLGSILHRSDFYSPDPMGVVTNYIPVIPGYHLQHNCTQGFTNLLYVLNWYDVDKVFLSYTSSFPARDSAVAVPKNAYFARFSFFESAFPKDNVYVTCTPSPLGYSLPTTFITPTKDLSLIKKWRGKKIGVIGDSISTNYSYGWYDYVNEYLGTTTGFRHAVGGMNFSNVLGVVTQANAIALDVMVIYLGTNLNTTIGSITDSTSTLSTYGYIKNAIETLLTWNPKLKLVFITPLKYRGSEGATRVSTINAIVTTCELYSIPVYELYKLSGISSINWYTSGYMQDELHPSQLGLRVLIGDPFARFLEKI